MPTRRPNVPRAARSVHGARAADAATGASGEDSARNRPPVNPARQPVRPPEADSADDGGSRLPGHGAAHDGAGHDSAGHDGAGHKTARRGTGGSFRRPGGRSRSRPIVSRTEPADPKKRSAPNEPGPVPAKAFSGRLLALAVVLVAIIVVLAPSVRTFLQQRQEISALQADVAQKHQQQDSLKQELARWDDPAFIKQQARDRLFLVMPGETRYLVIGAQPGADESAQAAPSGTAKDLPWVDALWDSVKRSATQ